MKLIKRIIKKLLRLFGYEISKNKRRPSYLPDCVSLETSKPAKGRVLLAYILEPFISKDPNRLNSHTYFWESLQIAQTYLSLGYSVDVIDFLNGAFVPQHNYDFFISARSKFQKIAGRLNPECFKVVHLDTAHWLFNNQAAYSRYLDLQQRRHVTLELRKILGQTWAIENADCATVLGNATTSSTYEYAGKKIFELPVPTCRTYPFPEDKDFEKARSSFIWMGSGGLVNKGLDLVLEAFSELPGLRLLVCGPIDSEKDFERVYHTELYQTANIITHGWIDVTSSNFLEIVGECVAMIYPSCAEGQAGAVATCMQASLIPIISLQSGFSVNDFGIILQQCTKDYIKQAVIKISQTAPEELKVRARNAWQYAQNTNSRENYKRVYKKVAESIIAMRAETLSSTQSAHDQAAPHKSIKARRAAC